jgi:hypothetical protein
VRSFVLTKTRAGLKIRLSWVKGKGRARWYVTLSTRINGRPKTKVVRGVGLAGSRTVRRTVRLPATWVGTRITADLELDNDQRPVFRTRSIRY